MLKRLILIGLLVTITAGGLATSLSSIPGAFSRMSPDGGFEDGWTQTTLPDVAPTHFALVDNAGKTVVQAKADGSAASLTRQISWDTGARPTLSWRWRIDRVVEQSDIFSKQGDDFAARLYVFFDYPPDRLSIVERTKLGLARWLYGDQVPAAALCYVWANKEQPGTTTWNAYTDRVRMIVLRNADDNVGEWVDEQRDIAADFRAAFGHEAPLVSGLSLAADTDQTGEFVTAWFSDILHGN